MCKFSNRELNGIEYPRASAIRPQQSAIRYQLSVLKFSVKISPAQSDFLNWSRWVAAWLVVAEHARSLIFLDYGELQSPGVWAKGFYFLTGFGHEAVMVFFVISGYLVGGKVWSLYREGRFGWRRYLADRLSRLYAVLFVALLLGAAMDWTGYLFFNKYGLYNQGYEGSIAVLGAAPIERMGWRDFLVNAFFLQTIVGPTFGSNGPLWSLAYEWWYYVLFPLALAAVWPIANCGWLRAEGKAKSGKAESGKWKKEGTTKSTKLHERGEELGAGSLEEGDGSFEPPITPINTDEGNEAGSRLASQAGAAFSNPFTSELARNCENTSPSRSASGPAGAAEPPKTDIGTSYSPPATAPEAPTPATGHSLLVTRALSALGSLLAVAGLCWFLTWEILIFFGVWLLGVATAALQPNSRGTTKHTKSHETDKIFGTTIERQGGRENEQPKVGPKGEGVGTTESNCSDGHGWGPAGGNQHADSAEFLEGHSQAGLQMDSEKLPSIRSANAPAGAAEPPIADSGGLIAENWPANSYSPPATAPEALARDSGRSSLDTVAPATSYSPPATAPQALALASSALSALFFGAVLLLARAEVLKVPYGWQYLLGVAFALVLLSLAKGSRRWAFSKPSAYLADFSYSVYLIHFPVLMLVISVVFSLTGYGIKIPFGALGLIWFAVVFAVAILFAWMVSLVTEARTAQLREVLYRIFRIEPRITPINTKI